MSHLTFKSHFKISINTTLSIVANLNSNFNTDYSWKHQKSLWPKGLNKANHPPVEIGMTPLTGIHKRTMIVSITKHYCSHQSIVYRGLYWIKMNDWTILVFDGTNTTHLSSYCHLYMCRLNYFCLYLHFWCFFIKSF